MFGRSVVSDSATPWTAARQASLSFTISHSLLRLMAIESVMPSNLLTLCRPLLLLPSIFPSIRVLARLLCPWNSPGKNTRVGSRSLFQGIFPTQGSNPGLPHCRGILYRLSHQRILKGNFQMPPTTGPLKTPSQGTPVVVQWLRLHLRMQGVWVRSLVRELRYHMPCSHKKKTNNNIHTHTHTHTHIYI